MKEFLARRDTLIATAEAGSEATRELCELTDEAVRELARAASSLLEERWAVVALGGWGFGGLLPASDLDILVLSDAPEARLKPFVEALLYPLWDAGLKVGHQVRSPTQQLAAMRTDLKTCTAALTARPLAGDITWAEAAVTSWIRDAHRRRKRVMRELTERPRPGSPFMLEVDLKEDAGGRRDHDELVWTAALLAGVPQAGLAVLAEQGIISDDELNCVRAARDTIVRVRWRLHARGGSDALDAESAPALGDAAEDAHDALASTALTLTRVRERLATQRGPAGLWAGRVRAVSNSPAAPSPEELFSLMDGGVSSLATLESAAVAGELEAMLPGFRRLMAVRRPGLGHRLTVGAHCLYAATLLAESNADRAVESSRNAVSDMRALQIAALTHDAAKVEGGAGHAERGVTIAQQTALRLGLDADRAHHAGELVRLHLALVETASREDLDDEDAILRCAGRIGDRSLVAPLHVLTSADSLATGPATWSPWMATLVSTLVSRLDAALSPDIDGAGVAALGERVRTEALARMPSTPDSSRAFVEAAPLRYLASRDAEQVMRDAVLVGGLDPSGPAVRLARFDGSLEGTAVVTAVAFDRPELLARLAGAIALAGLDILSVDAYGATGKVALDSFVVRSATGAPMTEKTFSALEELTEWAMEDRFELANRLQERRRHYPARVASASRVEVAPSGWDTTVVVEAPDRPGLLHDLAAAVSATGLDIRWARAQTVADVAVDTFHVVGPDGGPVDDPGVLGHLAMRLRELL